MVMAAPNSTAAAKPTTASVSSSFTGPLGLKPSSTTTAVSPAQSATVAAKAMRRAAGMPLPHGAGDDHALDLVRAFVDLGDLRVAHHALDRVLGDVAVAAEHLDGLDRDRHRGVGREQLRHRRVLAAVGLVPVDLGAR